jgi:hypothetical protein
MYLALHNDLIGAEIETDNGDVKVLDFLDYDSMTHLFALEVQDLNTLEIKVREFSDKLKYNILNYSRKQYLNDKRLNPKRR